jgi:1,4-dihydroxy-2-naphthoyl-CoA hydrolase
MTAWRSSRWTFADFKNTTNQELRDAVAWNSAADSCGRSQLAADDSPNGLLRYHSHGCDARSRLSLADFSTGSPGYAHPSTLPANRESVADKVKTPQHPEPHSKIERFHQRQLAFLTVTRANAHCGHPHRATHQEASRRTCSRVICSRRMRFFADKSCPSFRLGNNGVVKKIHHLDALGPFVDFVGLTVLEADEDRVDATWNAKRKLHQPFGIVHGGVHCTVVETLASIGAALWLKERGTVVGVNNSTDFFRAVSKGALQSHAFPLHRGRSQQVWIVKTYNSDRQLVSQGQVRLQNLTN